MASNNKYLYINNITLFSILSVLWGICVFLFIILPIHIKFDFFVYTAIFAVYVISVFLYFKLKNKKNYFDFDTIFILVSSVIFFLTPFYTEASIFDNFFILGFNKDLIISGTLLACIGMQAYMIGNLKTFRPLPRHHILLRPQSFFFYTFVILTILFVLSGGIDYYRASYNRNSTEVIASNALTQQMIPLMVIFSNLYCVQVFRYSSNVSKKRYIEIASIFLFSGVLATVGNRTVASNIFMPFLFSFFVYIKNLNLRKTLVLFFVGIFFMSVLQVTRTGDQYTRRDLALSFTDLTIPSATIYTTLEYVESNGYTFGKTMLGPVISCIPSLSSHMVDPASYLSASVITRYMINGDSYFEGVGLGTTLIGDIYMAFGVIGVIVLMFVLGRLVSLVSSDRNNLVYRIIECSLFASCVFMCRASYFYPIRFIVWALIIYWIMKGFGFYEHLKRINYESK